MIGRVMVVGLAMVGAGAEVRRGHAGGVAGVGCQAVN